MVAHNEHDTDGTEDSESRDAIRSDGTGDPEARSAIRSSEHHQVSDHETLDGVLNSPTRLSDEAETTVDDEVNHGTFDTLGSEVRGEANLLTPGQIHERVACRRGGFRRGWEAEGIHFLGPTYR